MTANNSSPDEKPLGRSLGWERLGTERLFRSHWHNLRRDTVRVPGGQEITYTYQEHPGFVNVVPVTDDDQVVLIRSYRYTVDDWCWELPAGGLGDGDGASMEEMARRELAEEVGGTCTAMRHIGWFYSLNGTSDARCHVFLATGVVLDLRKRLEPAEHSEVHLVPAAQAIQMAQDGRMTDGDSALAILRCASRITGRRRAIVVEPYDPSWPAQFEAEAACLAGVFGELLLAIHHMGSTAVPGLHAKPIIDILPEVRDIVAVDGLNDAMVGLGYEPKGENGIPGRRFFSRDVEGVRRFHVHVFQRGHPEIARHLDLVAYLKAHPQARDAYARLKLRLAEQHPDDAWSYNLGKSELIGELERQSRQWKESMES